MADLKPNTKYLVTKDKEGYFTEQRTYSTDDVGCLFDDESYSWAFPISARLVEVEEVVEGEGLSNPEFEWTEEDPDPEAYNTTYVFDTDHLAGTYTEASKGGPSGYYDLPFKEWVTTNDQIEYLAEHKWGRFSPSFKDIFKALVRWGDKAGVDLDYDAKKIIYYGARVLRQIAGTEGLRSYLQELLDDEQFK